MDTYNSLIAHTRAKLVAEKIDHLITNIASVADQETLKALSVALEKATDRLEVTR